MQIRKIHERIHEVRGRKVMLDFELAELYQVETKALNQAVKRNLSRFPGDFMFRLNKKEWEVLRSQIVTSKIETRGGTQYSPYAFTEHGVAMLASVLKSERAIKMNIAIVRAFIAMRQVAAHYKELAAAIEELERKYDKQFADIYEALQYLMAEKQNEKDWQQRDRIGFKRST